MKPVVSGFLVGCQTGYAWGLLQGAVATLSVPALQPPVAQYEKVQLHAVSCSCMCCLELLVSQAHAQGTAVACEYISSVALQLSLQGLMWPAA